VTSHGVARTGYPGSMGVLRAQGGSQQETSAQRTLLHLLEMAFGAVEPAIEAVAHALTRAGRDELPSTGPEIIAFVRVHLLRSLSDQVGPRLTMALLDDLIAQLETGEGALPAGSQPSVPPASTARSVKRALERPTASSARVKRQVSVLLVDGDRVGRTAVARAMIRAGWDVTVIESPQELAQALHGSEAIDVVVLDGRQAEVERFLEDVVEARPQAAVVLRSTDVGQGRALLTAVGAERHEVQSYDAPSEELVDTVRRVAAA
jgi:CheY-like chemotaxis protein